MDKKSIALATALTLNPTPAESQTAPTTQFSLIQNIGQSTTFSDPRAKGEGLRVEIRKPSNSGHITLGAESIKDTLQTGHSKTWDFNSHYKNKYFDFSAAGDYGASLQNEFKITGQRLTLDKNVAIVKKGPVTLDAKIGADIGYIKGTITTKAAAHLTLNSTYTKITPTDKYQKQADEVTDFFDIKNGRKFPQVYKLPATAEISDIWTKSGQTPYAGVSAHIAATMPITKHFIGNAQIGGRFGAEKTTSQACLGTIYTSNANPEVFASADGLCSTLKPTRNFSGYYLSAAFQRQQTHRDLFLSKAEEKAQKWADSGNRHVNELTHNPNYQQAMAETGHSFTIPTITKYHIMNIFGINPHLQPQNALIVQGGKTFNIAGLQETITAFARIAIPIKPTEAKPHGQIGLSYDF